MFCTTCATLNPVTTAHCTNCGARLLTGDVDGERSAARRSRTPSGRLHGGPMVDGRPLRTLLRRGLYLLPIVAVLLAASFYVDGVRARQRTVAAAYQRGQTAEAAGNYLEAIDAYQAAAGYRDAVARRAGVVARLAPYRDAYLAGVTALEAGRYDDAIAALLPVVRDLPTYEDAAQLLEQARNTRQEQLRREVDRATQDGDWLTVERTLVALVAENPSDTDLAAQLAVVRRAHAPLVFTRTGDLYLIGPDGGDERRIADSVSAAWPVWSPDRARIAFVSTQSAATSASGSLYVIGGDGTGLTQVATAVQTDVAPAWSPDGRRIAFVGGPSVPGGQNSSPHSLQFVDLASGVVTDRHEGIDRQSRLPDVVAHRRPPRLRQPGLRPAVRG